MLRNDLGMKIDDVNTRLSRIEGANTANKQRAKDSIVWKSAILSAAISSGTAFLIWYITR